MVCSFWGLDDCFAHVQTAECKPLLFSELGLLPQRHRHSPEPPSAPPRDDDGLLDSHMVRFEPFSAVGAGKPSSAYPGSGSTIFLKSSPQVPVRGPCLAHPASDIFTGSEPTTGSFLIPSPPCNVALADTTPTQDTVRILCATDRISCCGCGERRPLDASAGTLAEHVRCLSCNTLHHIGCLELSYGFIYRRESLDPWLCPTCSLTPPKRWRDSL